MSQMRRSRHGEANLRLLHDKDGCFNAECHLLWQDGTLRCAAMFRWRRLPQRVEPLGDIELEPRYSTREILGRCIKCLTEREYADCLRKLLRAEDDSRALQQRYEGLVSFLRSPEMRRLRDESERYLAEGRDVKVVLHLEEGKARYELRVGQTSPGDGAVEVT